jgi:hypothetical protein
VTRIASKLGATVLVLAMIFCSMMLWVGIPVLWLYIGSQLVTSTQPSMGPYLLVGVGILVSVVLDAMLISRLNQAYQRVTKSDGTVRVQFAWLRSMRGERTSPRPTGVLEIIMVGTVALAATAAGVWFFFFAGSSLPAGG